jgi:hypothetical protein
LLKNSGALMTESSQCQKWQCVLRSRPELAGRLLAALALLACLTIWQSSVLAQVAVPKNRVIIRNRVVNLGGGFRLVTTNGPNGQTGQASFDNVTVLFKEVVVAADTIDDDIIDGVPRRGNEHVSIVQGTADDLAFGSGSSAENMQTQLAARLHQEVETIDKTCKLTSIQKRKIELAGRGDIKHLLDRAETLKTKFEICDASQTLGDFEAWAKEVSMERGRLGVAMSLRASRDGTLLAKTLKTVLTPEQAAAFERQLSLPVDNGAPGNIPGGYSPGNGFF